MGRPYQAFQAVTNPQPPHQVSLRNQLGVMLLRISGQVPAPGSRKRILLLLDLRWGNLPRKSQQLRSGVHRQPLAPLNKHLPPSLLAQAAPWTICLANVDSRQSQHKNHGIDRSFVVLDRYQGAQNLQSENVVLFRNSSATIEHSLHVRPTLLNLEQLLRIDGMASRMELMISPEITEAIEIGHRYSLIPHPSHTCCIAATYKQVSRDI